MVRGLLVDLFLTYRTTRSRRIRKRNRTNSWEDKNWNDFCFVRSPSFGIYFSVCCAEPVLVLVSEWITFHFSLFDFFCSVFMERWCSCCCLFHRLWCVSSNVSHWRRKKRFHFILYPFHDNTTIYITVHFALCPVVVGEYKKVLCRTHQREHAGRCDARPAHTWKTKVNPLVHTCIIRIVFLLLLLFAFFHSFVSDSGGTRSFDRHKDHDQDHPRILFSIQCDFSISLTILFVRTNLLCVMCRMCAVHSKRLSAPKRYTCEHTFFGYWIDLLFCSSHLQKWNKKKTEMQSFAIWFSILDSLTSNRCRRFKLN